MVEKLPRSPSQQGNAGKEISISLPDETPCCTRKWYFSRQEIEDHSPSRKDGIDLKKESRLRKMYCSFLQELGMTLKVPQVTIATAIMLCHQFYMRQSHAKNDWQTIATVSMFLGCKLEDTTRLRKDVVTAAYEILHKRDPSAPGRIRQKELFNKQQELLLIGEKFLLATIAYDLDIQLPYKPLVAALKRLKLGNDIPQVAWNFVNDWLCTTLCLQYKPHYIAAGSVFLAAKYQKVKLPTKKGNVWWLEFDISPKLLEEVIKHMLRLLEQDKGQPPVPVRGRSDQPTAATGKPIHGEPKSSVKRPIDGQHSNNGALLETGNLATSNTNSCQNSSHGEKIATPEEALLSRTSESGNASSVIEDGDGENPPAVADSNQNSRCKIVSVENRSGDCDQNPSCKIASLENGAEDSGQNLRCSTVSGHNAESVVVEDGDDKKLPEARDSDQNTSSEVASVHNSAGGSNSNSNSKHMFNAARIRETVKKRMSEKAVSGHNAESVVVEDGDDKKLPEARDSDQNTSGEVASVHNSAGGSNNNSNSKQMIDAARIREMVKKRRSEKAVSGHNAESVVGEDSDDKKLSEARDSDQNTSGEVASVHNSAGGSNNNSKQMIDAARIREMVKKRRSEKAVSGHNAESVVGEDGDDKKLSEARDSDQNTSGEVASVHNSAGGGSNNNSNSKHMIDAARIREALKKRRLEKAANKKTTEVKNDDMDIETWIERKLENEIELGSGPSDKKRRIGL